MNEKEKAFVADLKELLKKHGVALDGSDEYGGEENFLGRQYTFTGPGVYVDMKTIERQVSRSDS